MVKVLFQEHVWGILAALFVAIVFVLPQIIATVSVGEAYTGVQFLYLDDDERYLAHIQEVTEGQWRSSSPAFFEYKDALVSLPPFSFYIYAIPLLLGVPLFATLIGVKFLLIFLGSFLGYLLMRRLLAHASGDMGDKVLTATITGLFVMLGYDLVDPNLVIQFFREPFGATYLPTLSRLVNPITGVVAFLGALILLWDLYTENKKQIVKCIGLVVLLLFLSSYIFSYAVSITILGFLVVLTLFEKRYAMFKNLIVPTIIGILPFLYQVYSVFFLESASKPEKIGLFYANHPLENTGLSLVLVLFLGMILILSVWAPKEIKKYQYILRFLGVGLVSLLILFNQQILTGVTIWPFYFKRFSIPIEYLTLFTTGYLVVRLYAEKLWRLGSYALLVVIIVFGFLVPSSQLHVLSHYTESQRYGPVFEWFNDNVNEHCVVLTLDNRVFNAEAKIPAYTECDVYHSEYVFFAVPDDRVQHNFNVYLWMLGLTPQSVEGYLETHKRDVANLFFDNWTERFGHKEIPWLNRIQSIESVERWLDTEVTRVKNAYIAFYEKDVPEEIQKYKLTHLLWDKVANPGWNPTIHQFLVQVYESGDIVIYEIDWNLLRSSRF